jgi:hypothetical protein
MAPRIVAGLGLATPSQQGAQADEPERPFVPESLAKLSSSAYLDDVFQLCRTTADGDFARAECAKLAPTVGLRLSEKPGKCQLSAAGRGNPSSRARMRGGVGGTLWSPRRNRE